MTLGIDPEDRIPAVSTKPASKWPRQFSTLIRIGVVVVVLGAVAASSWPYIKQHLTPPAPPGPVPVIGPGDQPIKEAPKQPGGMQVPDQDKVILNGAAAEPKVEQLLPPPPAPLPSPVPPTASSTGLAPSPPVSGPPAVAAAPSSTPPNAPAVPPSTAQTSETPAPQVSVAPPPPPPPPPPRAVTAATVTPPTKPSPSPMVSNESVPSQLAGHGWFVQLGAVSSTTAAQAEWTRLKHAQPDLLASLSANAVRVERSGAVLYRIEAGPLADADAATHLCSSLRQRHVACIVLRP